MLSSRPGLSPRFFVAAAAVALVAAGGFGAPVSGAPVSGAPVGSTTLDPMHAVREALGRGDREAAVDALRTVATETTVADGIRATAWNNLCVLLAERGDGDEALSACDQALALRRAELARFDADSESAESAEPTADPRRLAALRIARTLNNRGLALHALGRSPEAHAAFAEALEASRAVDDLESEAIHRANLATTADALGRLDEAFAHYRAVEQLARAHPDAPWAAEQRAVAWINQGATLERIGASNQALALYERLRDRLDELPARHRGTFLLNLGVVYRNLGDPVQALDAFAAASELFVVQDDRAGEVTARLSEGLTLEENFGRPRAARAVFEAALALAREIGDRTGEMQALDLSARSRLHEMESTEDDPSEEAALEAKTLREATERFQSALTLARAAGSLESEASALDGLARLARLDGDPETAWRHASAAVALVERGRAAVDDTDLRQSFFTPRRPIYDTAIEAAWARRGLVDQTEAARGALEMALRAKARDLSPGDGDRETFERALDARIERALGDPVSTVEYWLGERSVFAWVLGAGEGPAIHRCGDPVPLLERVGRVHGALRDGGRPEPGDLAALSETLLGCVGLDSLLQDRPLQERPLLNQPARDGDAPRRIRLATDRGLRFLPFEILPIGPPAEGRLLLDRATLVYLPSLAFGRAPSGPRVRRFVGFADPELGPVPRESLDAVPDAESNTESDTEFESAAATPSVAALVAARFALGPLEAARGEVARAAELLGDRRIGSGRRGSAGADSIAVAGAEADETTLRNLVAEGTRVLHLATHTVLDEARGDAAVLLAPSALDDGLWRPEEIAGLELPVDLVVLASCSSALAGSVTGPSASVTPERGGDALGSLSSALLGAGAGGVVASLWDTGDQATAALMDGFYRRLAAGDDPATALATAKRTLRSAPGWDAPHLWSAFVLLGDAPAIAVSGVGGFEWADRPWLAAAGCLGAGCLGAVILGVALALRRRRVKGSRRTTR